MRLAPLFWVLLAASVAPAQSLVGPLERQDDPPSPFPASARGYRSRTLVGQVNVDPNGLNIPGDAANEPSLAVDPLAPNRITVGWRQFDSAASNFRQAGRGYSRDGGRTWINPGPLDPGHFRSDPCLRADNNGNIYYL